MPVRKCLDDQNHLLTPIDLAFDLMKQLFPHGQEGSYFLFDLTVSHDARHLGIGRSLIDFAIAKVRAAGCKCRCLDVTADNEAVRFYERIGMHIAVETRVPKLADKHGVGTHLHMVLPL